MNSLKVFIVGMLLGFLLLPSTLKAQNLAEELSRIRLKLNNLENLYARVITDIDYAEGVKEDINFPSRLTTVIKMNNGLYFFENEMVTMVINNSWTVGAIHAQKQIIYGRTKSKSLTKIRRENFSKNLPLDSISSLVYEYKGSVDGIKQYVLEAGKTDGVKTEMFINSQTGFFSKLIYTYLNPSKTGIKKTETTFSDFSTNASFSEGDFSEKKIIRFNGKSVYPVEKYKNYNVIYTDPDQLKNF